MHHNHCTAAMLLLSSQQPTTTRKDVTFCACDKYHMALVIISHLRQNILLTVCREINKPQIRFNTISAAENC